MLQYPMKFDREQDRDFLRAAAQSLQDENARLRAERAAFEKEKSELAAQLLEAQEQVSLLEQEIHLLKEQLDRRAKALFGRKSERRTTGENAAPPPEEPDGAPPQDKKKRKPQRGHGPTPQPKLPVTEVTSKLEGEALLCEHCGGTLSPLGCEAERAELIALEERKIVLERHLRMKYHCGGCHTGVLTAPGPVKLIPGGRYALSFTVEVAYQKYLAHIPLDRQVKMFEHDGLVVTTSALYDQIDALATALTPTYQAIFAALQAEPVLHADETPWAVLSNGYTENERFYAWVAVGSQYVGYRLLDTRSKEGAATILGDFAGTLIVDGLTSYPAAAKAGNAAEPRFKVANCHAHSRRKFVECETYYPAESTVAIDLYRKLYEIEEKGKMPGADLAALRNDESRPLIDKLFRWANDQKARTDLLPSSGLAKAIAYLSNHEAGLRVFLDDPAVAIDNNSSERALRGPVLGRKNSYGSRSRRGTETAAILYTLTESARRVGVNPRAYLEAAAEYALREAGAVLLPDEFKRQLEDTAQEPDPPAPRSP
ncbi:MAG: IS66 family transposase [Cyanobacteria bacterium REEB65]|nr:IS66 family transposase [Cyanobacteria bacterium REEB65]